jgi:tetratricopeptide (TPR) repeat protein
VRHPVPLQANVSRRAYLYVNVAVAALAAAGIVVGLTLDTRTTPHQPPAAQGKPPVPTGLPSPYGKQIEQAFRDWPHGSIDTMQRLGLQYSKNALVQYYRGVALIWAGYPADAQTALELAKKLGRDTPIQGRADVLLHPNFFQPAASQPSYPVFIPLSKNPLLVKGEELQVQGHQVSAERMYQRAAKQDPNDVEAQVAVAVGLFDPDNLNPSFGQLGPLTAKYPRSQIVFYYLGYLLVWTNQADKAIPHFETAVKLGPKTKIGQASKQLLEAFAHAGASATAPAGK